jgi:hypothetical protein
MHIKHKIYFQFIYDYLIEKYIIKLIKKWFNQIILKFKII